MSNAESLLRLKPLSHAFVPKSADTKQTKLARKRLERFSTSHKTALNNYFNNKATEEHQQNNIHLAEKIDRETSLKYRERMATMSDLLQDEMSLSNAQANYLNALYKFREAELEIMALNG